jgi:hypothetical protein
MRHKSTLSSINLSTISHLAEIITDQPIYPKYICYFNTFSM